MLPKEHRLHQDKEIKDLVRSGRNFFLPEMTIKYKTNQTDATKIGFIVSGRVDKRAVIRNRLTRHLREVSRALFPQFKSGYLVLIIAKKKLLELNFETIRKQLSFAFQKIGLMDKK